MSNLGHFNEIGSKENFSSVKPEAKDKKKLDSSAEKFSSLVNKYISSPEEAKIYTKAGLKEKKVNDKPALIRADIDMNQKDEFGLTNRERMKNGNPPLASNGEIIELHHVGQKKNSPLAELTRSEHRGKGNDSILHDKNKKSEIDRNAFQRERQEHWKNREQE